MSESLIEKLGAMPYPIGISQMSGTEGWNRAFNKCFEIIRQNGASMGVTGVSTEASTLGGKPLPATEFNSQASANTSEISVVDKLQSIKLACNYHGGDLIHPVDADVIASKISSYLRTTEPNNCPDCGAPMMEVCSGLYAEQRNRR